jgi:cytochrome c-type biogenesis protein CcmH/NrfG
MIVFALSASAPGALVSAAGIDPLPRDSGQPRRLPFMRKESVVFGIAGIFFGLLVGWIIGSQQPGRPGAPPAAAAQASAQPSAPGQQAPAPFDEARAAALKTTAERSPTDAETRVQLGNLYFDAERYDEATKWYEAALKVDPRNVNASTDLGIAYYYSNQADRALAQFDRSLAMDPKHSKTLLNIGIVRAFGKQDLDGAEKAWQRVLDVAPDSQEAAVAKRGLDGLRAAHAGQGSGSTAKPPGQQE